MSTILESAPGPILWKRKDTDPCRSLFAGESKRSHEATKEDEASGVEKEDIGGGEEEGIFDKMRRKFCEKLKQEEADGGVELGLFEVIQICEEMCSQKLKEEEQNGGDEKEEGDIEEEDQCKICNKKGHCYYDCLWLKKLPPGPVPADIPSEWMVECKYCHGQKFVDKTGVCASCERGTKKVVRKLCYMCWGTGHLDNNEEGCLMFGQEYTPVIDAIHEYYKC